MQPVAQAHPILWQTLWLLVATLITRLLKDYDSWKTRLTEKKPSIGVAREKGKLPLAPSENNIDTYLL